MKQQSFFVIFLAFAVLMGSSCGGNQQTAETPPPAAPAEEGGAIEPAQPNTTANKENKTAFSSVVRPEKVRSVQDLTGYYVGFFGPNKINLIITKLDEKNIAGHTVVSGNDRPFSGIITQDDALYLVKAAEPGTDTYDGKFDFAISLKAGYDTITATGNWVANNKKYGKKTFTLKKTNFAYNPKLGMYPQASTRKLTAEDVENQTKLDLTIMRNEIYARHGYCFKNKEMRTYFDNEIWYMPMNVDIRNELSPIEKENEALIKKYEKYAQNYYDDYGR